MVVNDEADQTYDEGEAYSYYSEDGSPKPPFRRYPVTWKNIGSGDIPEVPSDLSMPTSMQARIGIQLLSEYLFFVAPLP